MLQSNKAKKRQKPRSQRKFSRNKLEAKKGNLETEARSEVQLSRTVLVKL